LSDERAGFIVDVSCGYDEGRSDQVSDQLVVKTETVIEAVQEGGKEL
jgi:hypothetical protein